MLKINEIYYSIQGESSYAGLPTVFVRLTYCNLRCSYCDTEYAFFDGTDFSVEDIISRIKNFDSKLVEITGGEPLMQEECLALMKCLCDDGYTVLIETGGSLPIENIDKRVIVIMDLKTPSSGMLKMNRYDNLSYIKPVDEIKFVIGTEEDYNWSKEIVTKYGLRRKCRILFSTVFGKLEPVTLVKWILRDNLDVRFQLQLHKYIWSPTQKGV